MLKLCRRLLSKINPHRSLKARLGLATGGIVLLLSTVLSLLVGYTTSTQLETTIGQYAGEIAYQMADKLDRGMFERYRDIQILASLDPIRESNYPLAAKRSLLEKLQSTYPDYAWIGLTNQQGVVLASTGKVLEGVDASKRPFFEGGRVEPYVGDVHEALLLAKLLPNLTGEPLRFVDLAAPVKDTQDKFQGVIAAHLSWAWATEVEKSLLQRLGEYHNVEIFILSQDGTVLLGPKAFQGQKLTLASVQAARANQNSYLIEPWLKEGNYVTGFAKTQGYRDYPGLGWLVLVRQKAAVALAPARSLQSQVFAWGIALGTLFAILGGLSANQIVRPMLRIAAAANRIRQGDALAKIPLVRGQDELAVLSESLRHLVSTLNDQQRELISLNEQLQLDITQRKQAEEALRQTNERLQRLFDSNLIGVAFWNIEGFIVDANDAFLRFAGYTREEFAAIGRLDWTEFTPPEYKHLDDHAIAETLSAGVSNIYEKEYIHRDGKRVPIVLGIALLNDCQREGVAFVLDITEQKRAEQEREQLLSRERQYAKQLHGLTEAALVMNSVLSIEDVLRVITEQARAIIGAHQSVTSMTIDQNWAQAINSVSLSDKYAVWRDYDAKTDGSGIYACVCHLNRSMRLTQAELEAHPKWRGFGKEAGNHPPMRGWLAAPLRARDGQNIGLIQLSDKYEGEFTEEDEAIIVQLAQMASIAIENTRLYEAEQSARTQAETANRLKDEFLAVLSHELRTPLNPILGWSKLLRTRKCDEATTTKALETIERNAKLQTQLIEDLLDVSRILRGKLTLNIASVDLVPTIEAAIETVRLAAQAKAIQIQTVFDHHAGQVAGDANRLQQVFWNLLSNAVKFTPQGGQVEIRLQRVGTEAQIQVSDTGKGISPEFLPYVFDYFRQADSTTTRVFGGLGLGLAIVRQLVELHGGTVWAESAGVGCGATFTVRLPLMAVESDSSQENELMSSSPNLEGVRVLVVDDEVDTLELLVFMLKEYGAQVRGVTEASEALLLISEWQPDLLLSDIGMPNVDGYRLIQQIRELESKLGRQIPAIALTAYAGETDHQQILASGFQKHVTKPVEPAKLVNAIASLVEHQQGKERFYSP
ncbi:response regulator [Microcoleus sp. FACHB-SPT15]|uniref:ATP-binding protein n=1 Tax=Microcoleus sp. FACHB-SPT15 TaxID=2692830 RepID=UPI0017860218|nr:ATP-binding protein [Microcoleus sp. FACHB-SPT15]MBD1806011.1 response regulator [Microcoleus sp. FACHB-SPT15]